MRANRDAEPPESDYCCGRWLRGASGKKKQIGRETMLQVVELQGVGAEVTGIQIATVGRDDFAELKAAFSKHGLLIFRDQTLTESEHIAFARRWGRIDINRFFTATTDYPEIAEVRKEADQRENIGGGWHTDHSYDLEPAMGSILVARELPASGGDTLFASTTKAYERLPDDLKAQIKGLSARHSSKHIFGDQGLYALQEGIGGRVGNQVAALQDVVHPMVVRHPLSCAASLYVNPAFTVGIVGMEDNAAGALLMQLYAHCIDQAVTTRLVWRPGTVAMWDNRATWHYALNDYHGQRRLMHRITVAGEALVAA